MDQAEVTATMTAHLDLRISSTQTGLTSIQGSLFSLCKQISELEHRVSSNEDNVDDLLKCVQTLEKENTYLKDRVDDAENLSWSLNLHFINVPVKSEGSDMIAFLSQLIPLLLGRDQLSVAPVIEMAHQSPTSTSGSRSAPRPILVRFLHLQDKVNIIRHVREKRELFYKGAWVHIYQDFSAGLIKKRRAFDAVKKILRAADIKYSLLYPCTLKVLVHGKPQLFRCPKEAEAFFRDFSVTSPWTLYYCLLRKCFLPLCCEAGISGGTFLCNVCL